MGGTISGEHGVGIEKRPMMSELFAPEDLALDGLLRAAFDPERPAQSRQDPARDGGCRGIGDAKAAPAQLGGMRVGSGDGEGAVDLSGGAARRRMQLAPGQVEVTAPERVAVATSGCGRRV